MPQRKWLLVAAACSALAACHKNDSSSPTPPAAQITPGGANPTTTTTSTTSNTTSNSTTSTTSATTTTPPGSLGFVIFDDELKSGGGAFLYPGGENQTLSFDDSTNPLGARSIRYAWNGQDVAGQHVFAGFDLMHSGSLNDYNSTPAKDLRSGHYSRVIFDARGSLSSGVVVKVEVSANGPNPAPCVVLSASGQEDDSTPGHAGTCTNSAALQGAWQRYTIPVTSADLASVKDYFKATFINKSSGTSSGGTVFFDNIEYQP